MLFSLYDRLRRPRLSVVMKENNHHADVYDQGAYYGDHLFPTIKAKATPPLSRCLLPQTPRGMAFFFL
jgi:hypothetical protein